MAGEARIYHFARNGAHRDGLAPAGAMAETAVCPAPSGNGAVTPARRQRSATRRGMQARIPAMDKTLASAAGTAPLHRYRWPYLLPIAICFAVGVFLYLGLHRDPTLVPSPLVGKPVPHFTLDPVKGREHGLSSQDLRGEVSLVNVFASWCVACRQEHRTAAGSRTRRRDPDPWPQLQGCAGRRRRLARCARRSLHTHRGRPRRPRRPRLGRIRGARDVRRRSGRPYCLQAHRGR